MKKSKGFTLIELLVAIILLSVLGLILGFSINNMMKKTTDREFDRYVDTIKSSASTYVSLNREAVEELYSNRSYVYVTLGELVQTGLLDEELKNPYTKEKINYNDVVKVNLDAITNAMVFTYPIDEDGSEPGSPGADDPSKQQITLVAMADVLDDEGIFNCMNGAGSYKLALSQEDGTLIHLANASGDLEGTLIKKYDINCKIPSEFTVTSGERVATADGSTYRTYKNYKVKEGTFNVEYTWLGVDNKIHKLNRIVTVKGKRFDAIFNANRGSASVDHIVVINNAPYGSLATATRANHIFGGWYLDGTLIESSTVVYATETHTLKARWMKKPTVTVQGYHKTGSTMNPSNGYVYKDVATVTYYGPEDNDDTITYYLKSESAATSSVSAIACGTGSVPGTCSGSGVTALAANTWYKVGSANRTGNTNVSVTYTAHNNNNVKLYTYVSNNKMYGGAGNNITIRKIDTKAPDNCKVVPTGTMGNNNYYISNITFAASGADAHSGDKSKTVNISSITTDTTGTKVTATLEDMAGNTVTCSDTYKRDITPPSCSSSGGYKWTNGNITITGTCSDATSKCVGNVTKLYNTAGHWTNQSPGTVYDNAGNSTVCPANQEIGIDRTPPTCSPTISNGNWTNQNVTITGVCADTGGSGCTGNPTRTFSSNTNSNESPGTVYDAAGNSAVCGTILVRVDKTAPTCSTSTSNGGWTNQNVTITGTCADTGGSGCKSNVSRTFSSNTNSNESPGTVYDNAGNSVTCGTTLVRIDKTPPTCSSTGGYKWTSGSVTITGVCADTGGSGCTGNATKKYDSQGYWTNQSPGTVYDYAGNSTACGATQEIGIDRTDPSCSPSISNGNWTNQNVTITGNCSDTGGSGCKANPTRTFSSNTNSNESPGTVYDNAGNSKACGTVLVRVDKSAPTCSTSKSNTGLTTGLTASASCSDTGGSGCTSASQSASNLTSSKTFTFYDNAGNSTTCTASVTAQSQQQACTGYNSCATSGCGVNQYNNCQNGDGCGSTNNSCNTAACGAASYNTCEDSSCGSKSCRTSACGTENYTSSSGSSRDMPDRGYCTDGGTWSVTSTSNCDASGVCDFTWKCTKSRYKECTNSACGYKSCAASGCGAASYNYCSHSDCGTTANTCRTWQCGVESYKTCADSACGCATWGSWTNTGSCSDTALLQCRTVYN